MTPCTRLQDSCARTAAAVSLLLAATSAPAADTESEQLVGAIDAVVFVCARVDARSAKLGLELLENLSAQRKLDVPALRKTDAYKSMYNSETNRLLSLAARERLAACKSAW